MAAVVMVEGWVKTGEAGLCDGVVELRVPDMKVVRCEGGISL